MFVALKQKVRSSMVLIFIAMNVVTFGNIANAQIYSTKATHGILIDVNSNSILFEKRADEQMKPASMAKILTLAVVYDAIRSNELNLDDTFTISEDAWRRGGTNAGGSTMFAEVDSDVTVENLIRGVAVQSGNDASIALAQGLSGSEDLFARRMNKFAAQIGMKNSNFTNSTGLPDEDQYTTPRDLAILATYVIENFPEAYKIFAEKEFTWNEIRQFNRNPLLKANIGADGLKTGFTKESGFGITASAIQDDRRLVVVLNGMKTKKERAEESKRVLQWGFRAFDSIPLFGKGEVLGQALVFGGANRKVNVVANRNVSVLRPRGEEGRITARVRYRGPLTAPVSAGEEIGQLVIKLDGKEVQSQPVFTDEDIEVGTLQQRALHAIYELTLGWFPI